MYPHAHLYINRHCIRLKKQCSLSLFLSPSHTHTYTDCTRFLKSICLHLIVCTHTSHTPESMIQTVMTTFVRGTTRDNIQTPYRLLALIAPLASWKHHDWQLMDKHEHTHTHKFQDWLTSLTLYNTQAKRSNGACPLSLSYWLISGRHGLPAKNFCQCYLPLQVTSSHSWTSWHVLYKSCVITMWTSLFKDKGGIVSSVDVVCWSETTPCSRSMRKKSFTRISQGNCKEYFFCIQSPVTSGL